VAGAVVIEGGPATDGGGGGAAVPTGCRCSNGAGACPGDRLLQAVSIASTPRISAPAAAQVRRFMWLIIIEALAALGLLIFIVWWTMFSGRRRGEVDRDDPPS
jgi:hypothetical protein